MVGWVFPFVFVFTPSHPRHQLLPARTITISLTNVIILAFILTLGLMEDAFLAVMPAPPLTLANLAL